jgi:hypothetical protein
VTSVARTDRVDPASDAPRPPARRPSCGFARASRHAGQQREEDARQQRGRHGECKNPRVQAGVLQARQIRRRAGSQHPHADPCDADAEGATAGGKHQVLDHDLPHHAQAARAERDANRRLLAASRDAREQQARQVDGNHEQRREDGPAEQHQPAPGLADDLLVKRNDRR